MPIRDLQMRARELGRIRLGAKTEKGAPTKLNKFRVTSSSKALLENVAALYGGTVQEWTPQGGAAQFEVFTDANRMPVLVPPQPVTQWHEKWTAGGCKHRCDGYTNFITGEPCKPDDPDHVEALTKPTTRLNVVLRDVEGMGVFRLESHGWNAAVELPNMAHFLAQAGGYVNGWLALEERVSKEDGKTRRFMVPIIEIDVTPAELFAGKGAIATPSVEGPVPAAALPAGVDHQLAPYFEELEAAATPGEVLAVFEKAKADGILGGDVPADHPLYVAIGKKGKALSAGDEPIEGELVDDAAAETATLWNACVAKAGELGMNLWTITEELETFANVTPADASVGILQAFLDDLGSREPVKA